jgi:anti-sigma B factor antagonist
MKIDTHQAGDVTVVTLAGDINSSTADQVQEQLLPLIAPGCKLLLDMSGVTYISSVGLRALLLLYRETLNQDGQIVLSGLTEMIRDTMFITGFLEFFEAYDSYGDGLAALAQGPDDAP